MPRIPLPLDPEVTQATDEQVYALHANDPRPNPLYDASGKRLKLDGTDPSQETWREEWRELYLDGLAKKKGGGPPNSGPPNSGPPNANPPDPGPPNGTRPVKDPVAPCDKTHWIQVTLLKHKDLGTRPTYWPAKDEGPYPSEPYSAEITDGHKNGSLDGKGKSRYDGIPAGSCTYQFTQFYKSVETLLGKPDTWPLPKGAVLRIPVPKKDAVEPTAIPTIEVAAPKLVVVKRDHLDMLTPKVPAHRLAVQLGMEGEYDGVGELTVNKEGRVKVFEAEEGGQEKPLPWGIKAADLKGGKTVYLEGVSSSRALEDTVLTVTLKGGGLPYKKESATDKLTCILLKIDVYKPRPDAGGEPAIFDDAKKIVPGRHIIEQRSDENRLWAQRAKLVLHKAEPAAYTGKVVLKALTGNVVAFAEDKEKPAKGQTALTQAELTLPNAGIDKAKGKTFWIEGNSKSAKIGDSGWTVELEDLPGKEGDRVTMTVLKVELELYQSRKDAPATTPKPDPLSDADKFDKGRYLHIQNTKFHHGRAMIVVKKVQPDGFVGKLELTGWDSVHTPSYSATKAATPKVKLFEEEVAATGQTAKAFPFEIDHPATFPVEGKVFWVEGGTVSTALRDGELRLGVKDADTGADRVEFTVVRFKKIKADIPSTPANQPRKVSNTGGSNSPVDRHELLLANPPGPEHYGEDFTAYEPLVLIEDSVLNDKPLKMSVEIEPAGLNIPVRWSVQRDKTATGDHKDIRALKGNDDLTITMGADPLKADYLLDNVGSFHIRPYIDCNGNDKFEHNTDTGDRIDREPFIIMNLVLVRVQGVANNSVANSAAFDPANVTKAGVDYAGGVPSAVSTGDFLGTGNDAVQMDVQARVIGGGQDGMRGLNPARVFAAWCNNELDCPTSPGPGGHGEDVTHHFRAPTPPPPPPPAPVHIPPRLRKTRCFWKLGAVEIAGPIMDSGYTNQGTGGDSCTGTMGQNGNMIATVKNPHASGIGEVWQVVNSDSPGGGITSAFPADATATLRRFTFNINFQCALLFWTNRSGASGPANHPACRLYVELQRNDWNLRLESTFDDAFVETVVTPITATFNKDGNPVRRATPVDGSGLETRKPDGLDQLQADIPF